MKRLFVAVFAIILMALPGWGESSPHYQAKAGSAAHRKQARNNPNRRRSHYKRHHGHHRHHNGA